MASQLELAQKPFIELQIEALVEENVIKPNRVSNFIKKLESRILSFSSLDRSKLSTLPLLGRPNSTNDDHPKISKFVPPEKIVVVGGFKTLTAIRRANYVDVAIPLPSQCLEKKDIKNQKYNQKRALYLRQLARLLRKDDLIEELHFRYFQGDVLKPVLILTPKCSKLKSAGIMFQLFVYPPEDVMKLSMLHPSHGNLAPRWFFKDYPIENDDPSIEEFFDSDSDVTPSPFYNSSILSDMEMIANSALLSEQLGPHTSLTEALMLAKIWLYQRELHNHFSFIISMYMAYLQTQQVIHQNMSSYQIFRTTIKSLVSSDWSQTGLSYFDDSKEKISTFKSFFPIIFLSPSGILNICYNITQDLYDRLKHEAQATQSIFASNSSHTFELLFLKKLDFVNKFDVVVHLPRATAAPPSNLEYLKKMLDHGVFSPHVYSEFILKTVRMGLTDRIVLVQQSNEHFFVNDKWDFGSPPSSPAEEDNTFTFGLLLDPEKSLRIADVGPEAQSDEAEEFRRFWGSKCELRLQNGIISETVVWPVDRFHQRRAIIKHILAHAMKRHDIPHVIVHYTALERFISLQNVFFKWRDEPNSITDTSTNGGSKRKRREDSIQPIGVGEEVFQKLLCAYNEFNKVLRNVDGMKHAITSIQPMSQHLRSSSVFPPLPVSLQHQNSSLKRRRGVSIFPENFDEVGKILHIEPADILLTLESTGKWPNELEAFEAARLEYLIELGEALQEREYSVKFADNFLDVLHGQFLFRVHVKCPKQLALISASSSKGDFHNTRTDLEIMPKIHSALDQLYREKPAFGLTCRLVKRWIYCQLLTDHFSDITLDLIVAHLFLNPEPYTEPSSSFCGFRRFLMLMAQHDWNQSPLMVNFNNQLKVDEATRLKDAMLKDRSKYPPMVISTPYDKETSSWTKKTPTMPLLDLLVRICRKAHQFICSDVVPNIEIIDDCRALFRPNIKLFDLIVMLRSEVVQNRFMNIDRSKSFKLTGKELGERDPSALKVMPVVDLNLIEQYVRILRGKYDKKALFFYDKYGQQMIGVVLKPESESSAAPEDLKKLAVGIKKLGSKMVESIKLVKNK